MIDKFLKHLPILIPFTVMILGTILVLIHPTISELKTIPDLALFISDRMFLVLSVIWIMLEAIKSIYLEKTSLQLETIDLRLHLIETMITNISDGVQLNDPSLTIAQILEAKAKIEEELKARENSEV